MQRKLCYQKCFDPDCAKWAWFGLKLDLNEWQLSVRAGGCAPWADRSMVWWGEWRCSGELHGRVESMSLSMGYSFYDSELRPHRSFSSNGKSWVDEQSFSSHLYSANYSVAYSYDNLRLQETEESAYSVRVLCLMSCSVAYIELIDV